MADLNPFDSATKDVRGRVRRMRNRLSDFRKTFTTAALLKTLAATVVAAAAAVLNFPVFAAVAVVAVFLALSVYGIYSTKILKAQDADARWTYVAVKRVQQENLAMRVAMDTVTLALMGEGPAPRGLRSASPELTSALATHLHRLQQSQQRADASQALREGRATDGHQRALRRFQREGSAPPPGPAIEPILARREALEAGWAQLEAEIQSLATAEDIAKAMEAEEVEGARRTKRERQEDARRADQASRDRVRMGYLPTAPEPAQGFTVQMASNGERNGGRARSEATPEQIARGRGRPGAS